MFKYSLIILSVLLLAGCENHMQYANAKECAPIQFPPHALQASHRYDIPPIAGNQCQTIYEIVPPYY